MLPFVICPDLTLQISMKNQVRVHPESLFPDLLKDDLVIKPSI